MKRPHLLPVHCTVIALLLAGCSSLPVNLRPMELEKRQVQAIDDARMAWERLAERSGDTKARSDYNAATLRFWKSIAHSDPDKWHGERMIEARGGALRLNWDSKARHDDWSPSALERVEPIRGLWSKSAVRGAIRPGIGVPVLALADPEITEGKRDPCYPKHGQYVPATAWIEFTKTNGRAAATLRISDPRELTEVHVGSQEVPLAADFASVEHKRLGSQNFIFMAIGGMFRPQRFIPDRGVFLAEPYRADKIPVVLTHGLASDPHIWQNLATAINADPVLGRRYQVWYFLYPTGLAVPINAAAFRSKLEATMRFHDPKRSNPGSHRMLLVGHSMGGLLCRMMAIDSGESFREAYFTKPLDQVRMSDELREEAKKVLYFRARPEVQRLVFITTPHEGSDLASDSIGRAASWLMHLPLRTLRTVVEIGTIDRDALNPELRQFRHLGLTSVDTLSPRHPFFRALKARPIKVPYYSIIGNAGPSGAPLEKTSDRIVPYVSAHLAGAVSEQIVPFWHCCVEQPDTVADVVRILREHLESPRALSRN